MRAAADLADRIAALEHELAALRREQADRADADFLLSILTTIDDWFIASEVRTRVPHLAHASAKSIGRRLKRIADSQDRAGAIPPLRLLRCKVTTRATVWKIETYLPASNGTGRGR